ncbi:DUF7511 domain-containing protein [Natrialbaceae archaeon A-gly3]
MSSTASNPTDGFPTDGVRRPDSDERHPIDLESVVVQYEDGPDRCTIAPRDCPDEKKLTTWLTADVEAFVDLEDAR